MSSHLGTQPQVLCSRAGSLWTIRAVPAPVCLAFPTVLFLIPPEPHIIDSIFSPAFNSLLAWGKWDAVLECSANRIYMDLRAGLTWVQDSKPSLALISCVAFKNVLILLEPPILLINGVLPMWIELEGIANLLIVLPLPWMG